MDGVRLKVGHRFHFLSPQVFGTMQDKARTMVSLAVPDAEFGMSCAGNLLQLFTHLLAWSRRVSAM